MPAALAALAALAVLAVLAANVPSPVAAQEAGPALTLTGAPAGAPVRVVADDGTMTTVAQSSAAGAVAIPWNAMNFGKQPDEVSQLEGQPVEVRQCEDGSVVVMRQGQEPPPDCDRIIATVPWGKTTTLALGSPAGPTPVERAAPTEAPTPTDPSPLAPVTPATPPGSISVNVGLLGGYAHSYDFEKVVGDQENIQEFHADNGFLMWGFFAEMSSRFMAGYLLGAAIRLSHQNYGQLYRTGESVDGTLSVWSTDLYAGYQIQPKIITPLETLFFAVGPTRVSNKTEYVVNHLLGRYEETREEAGWRFRATVGALLRFNQRLSARVAIDHVGFRSPDADMRTALMLGIMMGFVGYR